MSFRGKESLSQTLLISWDKFLVFKGKKYDKCWMRVDHMYMSRSNLSMMTAFKGKFHLILQQSSTKKSEGSYPKKPLYDCKENPGWWVQTQTYRLHLPRIRWYKSLSQPERSQLRQTYKTKHFRTWATRLSSCLAGERQLLYEMMGGIMNWLVKPSHVSDQVVSLSES